MSTDTDNAVEYRIEHDTMGEVRVPVNALYGAQTQRAVENFPISGKGLESTQIAALARIKKAAALANKELGTLDGAIADAIAQAADQVDNGAAVTAGLGFGAAETGPTTRIAARAARGKPARKDFMEGLSEIRDRWGRPGSAGRRRRPDGHGARSAASAWPAAWRPGPRRDAPPAR